MRSPQWTTRCKIGPNRSIAIIERYIKTHMRTRAGAPIPNVFGPATREVDDVPYG